MNTIGDGEENPEHPAPGFPLSAPVAADVLPIRVTHPYLAQAPAPGPAGPTGTFPASAGPAADGAGTTRPGPPRHSSAGFAAPVPASVAPVPASVAPVPTSVAPVPASVVPASVVPAQFAGPAADGEPAAAPEVAGAPASASQAAPPTARSAAAGRTGNDVARDTPSHTDYLIGGGPAGEPPEDPNRVILRKHLDALRIRAANASSWLEASGHYAGLVNRDGVVPVTARLSRDDIEFLGRAREEVLGFAELGLRLLELHAPLDAGGISTDPSSPILRCRSCMWRWPCPTFRMLTDALGALPHPGLPSSR